MKPTLSLLLLSAVLVGCEGGSSLPSPVLVVDLRTRATDPKMARLLSGDAAILCTRRFALASAGARQAFVVTWKVLARGADRPIVAVQLDPEGQTAGASSPEASASVGELALRPGGGGQVGRVPLRVTWRASKGCGKVQASTEVELRGDDPDCVVPKLPRLLTPVE